MCIQDDEFNYDYKELSFYKKLESVRNSGFIDFHVDMTEISQALELIKRY